MNKGRQVGTMVEAWRIESFTEAKQEHISE
jgi:hypothetical protein